jgi:hypothetical protein
LCRDVFFLKSTAAGGEETRRFFSKSPTFTQEPRLGGAAKEANKDLGWPKPNLETASWKEPLARQWGLT